ncbi:Abi family protein [Ramlibacter sp. G-1-2-2]|uniref:Abi family protein n=1 Tax=Ramlibacter agri TaxID=2728837 RepID=A0A848H1T1_9BURK|nr:Abi family protein [Ramlibacter agri]NML43469.1 Abi family protein [Ramlibacter agri]
MFAIVSAALTRLSVVCKAKILATAPVQKLIAYRTQRRWAAFRAQHPSLVEYTKPYRTPHDLVYKLMLQGLHVPDRKLAEATIFRENYYRFKAYAIPFLDKTIDKFHVGTTFDDMHGLYRADQTLRDFLIPLLAQLEVRIRATVDNVVTSVTTDPFWHINPEYFKNFSDVERALKKAQQRFEQGKQEFVVHHRNRYFTTKSYEYRRTPPFWVISEIFTLEQTLSVCKSLNEKCPKFMVSAGKNKLDDVASPFGLPSYGSLITNLGCILELRNLCAHHNRLWNRNLQNPGGLKSKHAIRPSHPNRLYSHLLMLRVLCKAQGIPDGIETFMTSMFASVPVFARDMSSMGFPPNWRSDRVWR